MNKLIEQLINIDQIKKIKYGLKDYSPLYIQALTDGIKAHLALAIFELLGENVVFITDNPKRSEKFLQDINQISAKAKLYPNLDTNFYNIKSIDDKKINQRLECLISLSKGEKFITVTNFAYILNFNTSLIISTYACLHLS